jgi:hypothetical protein
MHRQMTEGHRHVAGGMTRDVMPSEQRLEKV